MRCRKAQKRHVWGGHEQVHDPMPLARKRHMQRGAVRPKRGTYGAGTNRYTMQCPPRVCSVWCLRCLHGWF